MPSFESIISLFKLLFCFVTHLHNTIISYYFPRSEHELALCYYHWL